MDGDRRTGPGALSTVGRAIPHDSGHLHVSGRALYTDDIPEPRGLLHVAVGMSARAHAVIEQMDLAAVAAAPGVQAVITAADIPGENNYGPIVADDPIFAAHVVQYVGQPLFAVAATSVDAARKAAALARIRYRDLEPILDPDTAVANESFVLPSVRVERGNARRAIDDAAHQLSGRTAVGGQDHFYLEGQIAMVLPREDGDLHVYSSTQHPGGVQHAVAHAVGLEAKDVVVECRRMGGGFGGKESQPALIACIAALMSRHTGRPAKLRLDRDVDMIMTGKRHDYRIDYHVGFEDDGLLRGVEFTFASRCGMSADLSGGVNERTISHCDNAYFLSDVSVVSHRCKTHTVSNTAFRGFGGPQGMFAIEYVIDEIARHLGRDPLEIRLRNLYGIGERDTTHYGQKFGDNVLPELIEQLRRDSDYDARRVAIRTANRDEPVIKRGIALTPVKFGISFTAVHLNQAGALVHVYIDGTVHLNHGGTEMGQGLNTKVAQVVAEEFGIGLERIKITAADTSKVPNASATAASAGSDLNGMAARDACHAIRERLVTFAAERYGVAPDRIDFRDGRVRIGTEELGFAELVKLAYYARIALSATGYYRTPKIHYDSETLSGRPFYYYACGAAVSEVAIDTLTGESRVLRVDILHDCGRSLNPAIDLGQIEGGFIQGMGWLTTEELWWDEKGALRTHAPSTYKIPACSDLPVDFRVTMYELASNREETIHRSKAVGEPPLMLALSVFHAIRDAVAAAGDYRGSPALAAPATPEAVLAAVGELRRRKAS